MKTNELRGKRVGVFCARALVGALLAAACGGTVTRTPGVGSESHFLASCEGGCGGGLDCIGGICTRSCLTERASCSDLAAAAVCTNQSVEPGEVAVCDVSCRESSDCEGVGDGYSCSNGYCRQLVDTICFDAPCPIAGSGGGMNRGPATGGTSSGGTASGGSGGGSTNGGPGAPDCELFRDQSPPPDVRTISISNTGSVPLYIVPAVHADCRLPTSLVDVERGGQQVNVFGIPDCGPSCQEAIDQGWPRDQGCIEGCPVPQLVQILPGQTLQEPVRLEVAQLALPRACAAGIENETESCFTRLIPQPANYSLIVRAVRTLRCIEGAECECRQDASGLCTFNSANLQDPTAADATFATQVAAYYQSQELEIGVSAN